jgi:hypothetical protein
MRRALLGCLLQACIGCEAAANAWAKLRGDEPAASETKAPPEPAKPVEPAKPDFDRAAERVTAELLRKHVEALAGDDMAGRRTPSPELDRAADRIAAELGRLRLEEMPRAPGYRQRFECGAPGAGASSNVVALHPGVDAKQFVVVSAHYDHVGTAEAGEDRVFNGANDNASGVAAMLAIAEVMSALEQRPKRGVLFIAFCGEEVGLRGSAHFAEDPVVPLASIVADVNLEMLGRPGAVTPKRAWITGMPLSTLGDVAVRVGSEVGVEFVDGGVVGFTEGHAFERSDNYPLARAGVVAHSFSTGVLDEYYHHVDDESALLEYDRMVPIVRAIARVVWRLAEEDATPQWTDAGRAEGLGAAR